MVTKCVIYFFPYPYLILFYLTFIWGYFEAVSYDNFAAVEAHENPFNGSNYPKWAKVLQCIFYVCSNTRHNEKKGILSFLMKSW